MKIAVCISGMPGTFLNTAPTLKSFFEGREVDIFLHLWLADAQDELLEKLFKAYNPKSITVTERPEASQGKMALAARFSERPNPFSFDMFYGIEQSLSEVGEGAYTHIVRARYDTIFDGQCPNDAFPTDMKTIVVPDNYTPPNGCNDQFAVGSERAMRIYAGMYKWLSANYANNEALPDRIFASNPSVFRPEQALDAFLKARELIAVAAPLALTLLRPGDIGKAFKDLPFDVDQGVNILYEQHKARRDRQHLGLPTRETFARVNELSEKRL